MSLRDVDLYNDIDSLSALICECILFIQPLISLLDYQELLESRPICFCLLGGQDGGGVLQAVRVICLMEYAFIARTPILVIGKIQ